MKPGQMIRLRAYGGQIIERRLVRLDKNTLVVCRPEEYDAAQSERREPIVVGFHIEDAVGTSEEAFKDAVRIAPSYVTKVGRRA